MALLYISALFSKVWNYICSNIASRCRNIARKLGRGGATDPTDPMDRMGMVRMVVFGHIDLIFFFTHFFHLFTFPQTELR